MTGNPWLGMSQEDYARLIAAAPDMLDALKAVMVAYGDIGYAPDTGDSPTIAMVKAAIAKAAG